MAPREIWFEYWQEGRRFKASAVHWKGWIALVGLIGLAAAVLVAAMAWLLPRNVFLMVLVWGLDFGLLMAAIFTLLRRYGRPRKGSPVRLW